MNCVLIMNTKRSRSLILAGTVSPYYVVAQPFAIKIQFLALLEERNM